MKPLQNRVAEERARYALALVTTWSLPFDHPYCAALRRARHSGGPMPGLGDFARTASVEDAEIVGARLHLLASLFETPEWNRAFNTPTGGPPVVEPDGPRAAEARP